MKKKLIALHGVVEIPMQLKTNNYNSLDLYIFWYIILFFCLELNF